MYSHLGLPDEYVPKVLKFLGRIKLEIEYYYKDELDRFVNYEDLYYVASQIKDSESGEYDNPIVQPFIDKILPDIKKIFIGNNFDVRQSWLQDIANETTHYISDIVYCLLSKRLCRLDHLCCIKDACQDTQLNKVDIYTLNHDILLEQYLSENNIQIRDGFGKSINNVRYWDPDLFLNEPFKVRLFKLHGSVNWFRFRPDGGDWSKESIGISLEPDIWHTNDSNGQMQRPVDGRPMFLAGNF